MLSYGSNPDKFVAEQAREIRQQNEEERFERFHEMAVKDKFLVTADHPVLPRPDQVCDSREDAETLAAGLRELHYENVRIERLPDITDALSTDNLTTEGT